MQELLEVVERLTVAVEQLVQAQLRHDREQANERLHREWGTDLHRFGLAPLLTIPGVAAKFDRTVPADFTFQTGEGEIEISCPCGHTPKAIVGRVVGCECERWFLNDGRHVHVALSPGARSDSSADPTPPGAGEPEHQLVTTAAE